MIEIEGKCATCKRHEEEKQKMMTGQWVDVQLVLREKCPICGRSWKDGDKQQG